MRRKGSSLNILRIHPFYPSSAYSVKRGTIRYEQDRSIAERGHKIFVVSCKTFGAPNAEKAEGIGIYRVPSIALPIIEYPLPNLMIFYSIIKELIKRHKIELIHIEDGAYLTSLLTLLVKWLLKKPVILSMQGFPGFSWFYGNPFVDLAAKIYTLTLGRIVLKTTDLLVLSVTRYVEGAVSLGVHPRKIRVIPRGIDLRIYRPDPIRRKMFRDKLKLKNDDVMILFAGRLVPVKGLRYFIDVAKKLLDANKKLKFIVAGDGALRSKYQKETWNLRDNIRFIGYRLDMENVMNAADIFVLSSISEGCPNAVIEAGACAKPVVATDVGAVRDIIVSGETGLIVPPKSIDALGNALNLVISDLDRANMGEKAKQQVENNFSWTSVASQYEKIYEEILHQRDKVQRGI